MNGVFAVVVTFNRPEMLRTCIQALWKQRAAGLERIYVVVNSDDQETREVLSTFNEPPGFLTYKCLDNPGPAGGFYHGLEQFLAENFQYAWLMDDDVVPADGCLQELMKHTDGHDYILPRVIKSNGEEVVSFGWWGVLLSRQLILKVGLPIPELFFWAEDTEYLQNRLMHIHKASPFRIKDAVVSHLHLRKKKYPSWYYYYIIRNTLYYRNYIVGYNWRRFRRTIYLYIHSCVMILLKEDHKLKKLRLVLYGTYHGLRGRIGKLVDPAHNK